MRTCKGWLNRDLNQTKKNVGPGEIIKPASADDTTVVELWGE